MKKLLVISCVFFFAVFLNATDLAKADDSGYTLNLVADQDTLSDEVKTDEEKSLDEIVEDENWKKRLPMTDWDWEWNWDEDKKMDKDSKGRKHGYFRGGAGGWDIYYLPLSIDNLNTEMGKIGLGSFDNYMILNGGGGWGYLGKSIRIGGVGAGGEVIAHGKPHEIQKEVALSIGFGGFTIDKVCHPFNKTELYLGLMAGGGNATLNFVQHGENVDWNDIINGYSVDYQDTALAFHDYRSTVSADFFTLLPTVGFRYNIFRWFAVGANVGYIYTIMDQEGWQMDHKRVENMPDLDFNNVIYRINFYFGG
jgi:hypothetical protein